MILKTELQTQQIAAVEKLTPIKVQALFMEMGTGKTRTAIELIYRKLSANKVNKVLWLCPCSVKRTIEKELLKHIEGDIAFIRIEGIESLSSSDRLYVELLDYVQKNNVYLIIDESNLVKNFFAIRTKRITELSKLCKYKMILNGTPISKSEKDMFAQWYIIDWRILGYKSYWSFAANHLEYDSFKKGGKKRLVRVLNVDYLVRKIAPYTYQVKKSECLDLPPKTYSRKYFDLTAAQECHYEEVMGEFLMAVDDWHPSTIYNLFNALQHVVSGNRVISKANESMKTEKFFKKDLDNPRIEKLLSLLGRTDEKVIIWCKYTHEIKSIEKVLSDEYGPDSVVTFYGELPRKKRVTNIDKFSDTARFFVANKTCAGYGLNLQFCSYAIYYNNDWDLATRMQSEDRVHRIGQENNVHIVDIVADSKIDERILKCLDKKEGMVDNFKGMIDKMKNITTLRKWINGKEIGK